MRQAPEDVLTHYDVFLTETLLTEEWQPGYSTHVRATQGPLG
jgi:hypothetical protein